MAKDSDFMEESAPEYLRKLAERIMHIPVLYGVDQGDADQLKRIASQIERSDKKKKA